MKTTANFSTFGTCSPFVMWCLLLVAGLTLSYNTQAQTAKSSVWVHGAGGSADSWKAYYSAFPSLYYMNNPDVPAYNSTSQSVSQSALQVKGLGMIQPQKLIIAHSLGGLVMRKFIKDNPNQVGGVIIAATSHKGVLLGNALVKGEDRAFSDNLVEQLGAGPSATILGSIVKLDIFLNKGMFNILTFGEVKVRTLKDIVSNEIRKIVGQSANDLAEGSTLLTELNSEQGKNSLANIPKVVLWGNENAPVIWRTWQTMRPGKDPANLPMRTDPNDTYDDGLVKIMDYVRGSYSASKTYSYLNTLGTLGYSLYVATQWQRGIDWIDNAEPMWAALTGATRPITTTYTYTTHGCDQYMGTPYYGTCVTNCNNNPGSNCWVQTTNTVTAFVNTPTDGVVPQPSATALPGVKTEHIYPINGASHLELRNHGNVTDAFKRIFSYPDKGGDREINPFFKMVKR